MFRNIAAIVLVFVTAMSVSLLHSAEKPDAKTPADRTADKPTPAHLPVIAGSSPDSPIDDIKLDVAMNRVVQALVEKGKLFDRADLEKVLNRKEPLDLAPLPIQSAPLDGPELYRRASNATVALYSIAATDAKAHKGARLGAAFFVHPSGIAVTCYHAMKFPEPFALSAAMADGKVLKVVRILAVYPRQDVAFIKIEGGGGANCLPLQADAPAGMRVHALGHPAAWHFYMIEGTLARYGVKRDTEKTGAVMPARLNLSVDSGPGFSGGPVLDPAGNVVGMIDSMNETLTGKTIYKVHSAIPANQILARFTEEYRETLNETELRQAFLTPATRPASSPTPATRPVTSPAVP